MVGKPGQCSTCRHRERSAIDLALARGIAMAALSRKYRLSRDSLYRHRAKHLPPQLKAQLLAGPSITGLDLDKLRETESQSLLAHLISLRHRLFGHLDLAEEHGDLYAANRTTRVKSRTRSGSSVSASSHHDCGSRPTTR
jgi:hypothetical protein